MYRKNGSFPWADMKATIAFWIIVALIPCYNIFHDIFLGLTGFLIVALHIWGIFYPFFERFSIKNSTICIKKLFSSYEKIVPEKSVLVITDHYVRFWFSGVSTQFIGQYAVSIIENMPIDEVLNEIRGKQPSQVAYSNYSIESDLKWRFIYSFVLNEEALDELLSCTKATVIIPESLIDKININNPSAEIYIDKGWFKE